MYESITPSINPPHNINSHEDTMTDISALGPKELNNAITSCH